MDKQTLALVNEAGLPFAILAASVFSYACKQAAAWFVAKTHNERAATVITATGHLASDIVANLQTLPAGSDLASVKTAAVAAAVSDLKNMPSLTGVLGKLGMSDATLTFIVAGQVGHLQVTAPESSVNYVSYAAPVPVPLAGQKEGSKS